MNSNKLDELPELILSRIGQFLPFRDKLAYRVTSRLFCRNAKFFLKFHLDETVATTMTYYKLQRHKSATNAVSNAPGYNYKTSLDDVSESTRDCIVEATVRMCKHPRYNSVEVLRNQLLNLSAVLDHPVNINVNISNELRPLSNGFPTEIMSDFPMFTLARLEWHWIPKDYHPQGDVGLVLRQLLSGPHRVKLLNQLTWTELVSLDDFDHHLGASLVRLVLTISPDEWLARGIMPTTFVAAQFPRLEDLKMTVMRPVDLKPLAALKLKRLHIKFRADLVATPLMFQPQFFTRQLPTVETLIVNLNRLETETGLNPVLIGHIKYLFLMMPNVKTIRLKMGFSLDIQCLIDALKVQRFPNLTSLEVILKKSNDLVSDSFWAKCDVRDGGGEIIPLLMETANTQAPNLRSLKVNISLIGYDLDTMVGQIVLESPSSLRFLQLDHVVPKFQLAFEREFGQISRIAVNYFIRYVNMTQVETLKLNSHAYDQLSLRQFLQQIAQLESIEGTFVDDFVATVNPRSVRNGVMEAKLNWQNPVGKFRSIEFHFVVDGDDWVDSDDDEDF